METDVMVTVSRPRGPQHKYLLYSTDYITIGSIPNLDPAVKRVKNMNTLVVRVTIF